MRERQTESVCVCVAYPLYSARISFLARIQDSFCLVHENVVSSYYSSRISILVRIREISSASRKRLFVLPHSTRISQSIVVHLKQLHITSLRVYISLRFPEQSIGNTASHMFSMYLKCALINIHSLQGSLPLRSFMTLSP